MVKIQITVEINVYDPYSGVTEMHLSALKSKMVSYETLNFVS